MEFPTVERSMPGRSLAFDKRRSTVDFAVQSYELFEKRLPGSFVTEIFVSANKGRRMCRYDRDHFGGVLSGGYGEGARTPPKKVKELMEAKLQPFVVANCQFFPELWKHSFLLQAR